ncbi:CRISPR system precrRNA processing endoribonuclease RAMP protein Cas6 [Dictyobacter formicarum]|uniref:CRISPR-associated protein Cas6 C-terminal domain-containing protein n=1 Tax=Dictyobacter formicarum TaxID=2778368 RepID=A0ABQ3VRT6_9CHLR|nr:CRISPR system precrRNA processing endoribonuclease RAMP protein Cas6 [Dictyobacter formicarum]GHO88885.1 hypothetical protein KSZ_68910 [Dictyobacter formicarum]
MAELTIYPLLFHTQVTTPLELDKHSGAALRGNLFAAVWQRFCHNKAAPSCAACPLHTMCPVSALVAPLREEHIRGRDIPRPYILLPPLEGNRRMEPGETLTFGLTLFGNIIALFPYLALIINSLEIAGLGKRLPDNRGRRGTFKIQHIEAYNPVNGTRQTLSQAGKQHIETPTLHVTRVDVKQRAATLSAEQITIRFLTPTRLQHEKGLVRDPAFQPLVARLLERLALLEQEYGQGDGLSPSQQWKELMHLASEVICTNNQTHWEDVGSYSSRTRYMTQIGGICGSATFTGNLAPFHELLVWGEMVHVGKNAVKGSGWYRIESSPNRINHEKPQ